MNTTSNTNFDTSLELDNEDIQLSNWVNYYEARLNQIRIEKARINLIMHETPEPAINKYKELVSNITKIEEKLNAEQLNTYPINNILDEKVNIFSNISRCLIKLEKFKEAIINDDFVIFD